VALVQEKKGGPYSKEEYPEIITDRDIYGKSLEFWVQEYWEWAFTVPLVQDIPIDEHTGMTNCYVGTDASNTMLFLFDPYDATYSTKCEISSGKAILVPLLISECDRTEPDPRIKDGEIEGL
jgi:hypothetical protein